MESNLLRHDVQCGLGEIGGALARPTRRLKEETSKSDKVTSAQSHLIEPTGGTRLLLSLSSAETGLMSILDLF